MMSPELPIQGQDEPTSTTPSSESAIELVMSLEKSDPFFLGQTLLDMWCDSRVSLLVLNHDGGFEEHFRAASPRCIHSILDLFESKGPRMSVGYRREPQINILGLLGKELADKPLDPEPLEMLIDL